MRFEDSGAEWRINDIERSLNDKADSYRLDQTSNDVCRLEYQVREISALVDGLRAELERCQDQIKELTQNV